MRQIISKFNAGRCLQVATFVHVPLTHSVYVAQPKAKPSGCSIVYIKLFSQRERIQEPILSGNPTGIVCILNERISVWPSNAIGLQVAHGKDRYCFGKIVRVDSARLKDYRRWRAELMLGEKTPLPGFPNRLNASRLDGDCFSCENFSAT